MEAVAELPIPPAAGVDELARALARAHTVADRPPSYRPLRRHTRMLGRRTERLFEALRGGAPAAGTVAAEWLLDNHHVLSEALALVEQDLDPGFVRKLPGLETDSGKLVPRIQQLARCLVREGNSRVDLDRARRFLDAYQSVTSLELAELWAFPAVLRVALLSDVVDAGEQLTRGTAEAGREPVKVETFGGEVALDERIAGAIGSLRLAATLDWKAFVESVSRVERTLRSLDPTGTYARMDFDTRDRYRKAVEAIASRSGETEAQVALRAAQLARDVTDASEAEPGEADPAPRDHVGFYLLDEGRLLLEAELGARAPLGRRAVRWMRRRAVGLYLTAVAVLTLAAWIGMVVPLVRTGARGWEASLIMLFALVPASTVAVTFVQWLMTHVVTPKALPKMDFRDGIPDSAPTAVVVPCLLSDRDEIRAIARQLELNYGGNPDPQLRFVLLTDHADARDRVMPGDADLLDEAVMQIRELNRRYGPAGSAPFLLLHRPRMWNEAEGCWMGWERKRGKLTEFNRLVLGLGPGSFSCLVGDLGALDGIRFVITLDADTFLPQGTARRLVGTLGHPLNAPRMDAKGRLSRGYTVLQPRIETFPGTERPTRFAKVFEADRGLDLYSHAVSDAYQDLFRIGIYAGKGIYHVEAFHRSLDGRVPENALLSHDLFEGVHGRAALATDVAVFEDFPSSVLTFMRRLHRWVRGDWQIWPWLLPRVPAPDGSRLRNPIGALGRWQIADNLRRSLLMTSLLLLLLVTWLSAAQAWWWGMLAAGVTLGMPVFLGAATTAARARFIRRGAVVSRSGPLGFFRWCLAVAFLPFQAIVETDAVMRTWVRMILTRRHLLEWTTASHMSRALGGQQRLGVFLLRLAPATVFAAGATGVVWLAVPSRLIVAGPVLAAWLLSPLLAWWISQPSPARRQPARHADAAAHRHLARRTWAYFERFLGPDHHWLPPDNFQEHPGGKVAPRTSPTNIGLGLLSTVAAYDFGYLTTSDLTATLPNILEGVEQLELHRGHLLNWYDTQTLEPLSPRYVSTVDSGNLAASLVTLQSALAGVRDERLPRTAEVQGLLDTLGVLSVALERLPVDDADQKEAVTDRLAALRRTVESLREQPHAAARAVLRALDPIERELEQLIAGGQSVRREPLVGELWDWLLHAQHQARRMQNELDELMPWLHPESGQFSEADSPAAAAWDTLRGLLPSEASLGDLPGLCAKALRALASQDPPEQKASDSSVPGTAAKEMARIVTHLRRAEAAGAQRLEELRNVEARCRSRVEQMEFSFLYDKARRLFHIGYNVTSGELDGSYYDLLASEARLASYVAIAKRDVPAEHWLHLGRPFGKAGGDVVLLSWAGTMFEYLMPQLLLRMPTHSLLAVSCHGAVEHQIRFAQGKGIPWGVSESAYHELDEQSTYQYRAFGVPALGLRRDLGDRLVVAPYASVLALPLDAEAVSRNIEWLESLGAVGEYGLYESLDFSATDRSSRLQPALVRTYMAHHQGMILVALDNLLHGDVMVDRFHANAATAAAEFLLHERAPGRVRLEPLPSPAPTSIQPIPGPPAVRSWTVPADGAPQATALSNGRLSALVTSTGAGGLRWGEYAVTRWHADLTVDPWGHWLYLQDLQSDALWSAGRAPTWSGGEVDVTFAPHEAEYHRLRHGLSTRVAITVPPGADIEIRRVTLVNDRAEPRRLHVTNYAEVSLAPSDEDARHPSFVKLFVESSFRPEAEALVYRRRPASEGESPLFLAHAVAHAGGDGSIVAWETDRERFLGRHGDLRRPDALRLRQKAGPGVAGNVLDAITSFTVEVTLPPTGEVELIYLTAVGRSAEEVLETIDTHRTRGGTQWAFQRARARAQTLLHRLEIDPSRMPLYQGLLSALLHPYHPLRGRRSRFPERMPQQQGLWALGISGDLPLLTVRASTAEDTALLADAVKAYALWREQNVRVELAILDESGDGYLQPLLDWLRRALARVGRAGDLNRPRGVHYLVGARLEPRHRATLEEASHVLLDAGAADLEAHLALVQETPHELPPFVPVPTGALSFEATRPLPPPGPLEHHNGLGGFTPDGREYRIRLDPSTSTPAPWINVIATPELGFIVSEAGSGFSWAGNSGEGRLTTWGNDPTLDRSGEALYVRDEETADYWSPTPRPRPGVGDYEVRHGAGYSEFRTNERGLRHRLELFASRKPRAKIVELELENGWSRHRRLTVTYFAEWVLGANRQRSAPHLETDFAGDDEILLARDLFSEGEEAGVAFLASDLPVHGWTADRREFLGSGGTLARPAALERIGLDRRCGIGVDPCAALQVHVNLAPGESRLLRFFLGWGKTREDVVDIVHRCRHAGTITEAKAAALQFWERILSRVTVRTPEPAMNILLNRWLLYQALSCRLWGRSALYQSSGAFGFRDQLQDSLAFLFVMPNLPRDHLLEAASRQFAEGDVLHWWHPPSGRGVRTRCSDDLLWLPFVAAAYVRATGDDAILRERVPYLSGAPLGPDETERYGSYVHGGEHGTLYQHCLRALDQASTRGAHGLPLIGSGDWNDGFDRVGLEGRGESVWLAWFLYATLAAFADVADARDDRATATRLRERAEELRERTEAFAWDGAWYLRATFDDGAPLGSAKNQEARIDAISQAWAVLSGAGSQERVRTAMESVWGELVREEDGLVLLLTPPFDRTPRWPGYIKAYPPGVRENGGQYTHAALWTAWAYTSLADGDRAGRCFRLLNPLLKAASWDAVQRYRVEPYVVAADVYSVPPHVGRGGWTWYTGSAAWMWRLGTEAILGLRPADGDFVIDPCIPSSWPGYEMTVRVGEETLYRIDVKNPEHVCGGVIKVEMDGARLASNRVPAVDDGKEHRVAVRLGRGAPSGSQDARRAAGPAEGRDDM